jgi:serine/threonine-protein kinase
MKALAKNQLNRYQSAGDMRQDLQRALAGQAVSAEAVMTDAERTQFIARTPPPPAAMRRTDYRPPDDEDDGRRTGLIWAAVVIALLIVIGVASYLIVHFGSNGGPKLVAVPSVVGQSKQAADNTIRNANLKPRQGADTHGPCADGQAGRKGFVCTVEPNESTNVQDGSTVTYHLYTPAMVSVPAVTGLQLNDAENKLHDSRLQWHIKRVNTADPAGTVRRQDPVEFTTVAPNSFVTLYVSSGKLRLPDVTGKKLGDAQRQLFNLGFTDVTQNPTPVPTPDQTQDGTVKSEEPGSGVVVTPGTPITLTVYQYQAPTSSACVPTPPDTTTTPAPPTTTPTC